MSTARPIAWTMAPVSNPWRSVQVSPSVAARRVAQLTSQRTALRAERRSLRLYEPGDPVSRMALRGEMSRLDRQIRDLRAAQEQSRGSISRPGRMKAPPLRRGL
jgi:hypothetical protein